MPPLIAIDGAKLALVVGPFIPDADATLLQPFHIGVAAQEPEQLIDDGFEMQLLRREERKALREAKAQLPAEHRERAGARTVGFTGAMREHVVEQVQIGAFAHRVIEPTRSEALLKRSAGSLASMRSSSGWCAASASGSFGTGAVTCMRISSAGPAEA